MNRTAIRWAIVLALLLAGLGGWAFLTRPGAGPASPEAGPGGGQGPRSVEVVSAEIRDVPVELRLTGSLRAIDRVAITSEVEGRVAEILFEEGLAVDRGELLLRLDERRAAAEVARAEARVEEAARETERQRQLEKEDFSSERTLDQAIATEKVARAELEMARERLDDHRIVAPFAGITGRRLVSLGAYIRPGAAITTLTRLDPLELLFEVPENRIGALAMGQRIEARTPAFPDRVFTGRISLIAPEIEEASRTLPIEATIPNEDGLLRPGMFMSVTLTLEGRRSPVVPEAAVVTQGPAAFLYTVTEEDVVDRRSVETGVRRDGWVEIRSGLEPGATVIVKGHQGLRDGMTVRVKAGGEGPVTGPVAGAADGG